MDAGSGAGNILEAADKAARGTAVAAVDDSASVLAKAAIGAKFLAGAGATVNLAMGITDLAYGDKGDGFLETAGAVGTGMTLIPAELAETMGAAAWLGPAGWAIAWGRGRAHGRLRPLQIHQLDRGGRSGAAGR